MGLVDRRILKGEKIPTRKSSSPYSRHTQWVNKGKTRPNVELSKRLSITTDQHNLIVDHKIMDGQQDRDILIELADRVLNRYPVMSWSFDKGFWRKEKIRSCSPVHEKWEEVASKLVIRRFEDGTIKEYKGYAGDTIKQADVNLLSFPLDYITDKAIIKKNVAYYNPLLSHDGPAMSRSVYAVLSARLGDCLQAKSFFDQSYLPYKKGPYGMISEATVNIKPYFLTGAGGMLQVILYGFAGLEITENGLIQSNNTCLPEGWESITLKGIGVDNKTIIIK